MSVEPSLQILLQKIHQNPEGVSFDEVIATIKDCYQYTPTRFSNGLGETCVINEAGQNEGSCRIFAFARLHRLDEKETLHCFGRFYREDVLGNPDGNDHANIRHFMRDGWAGVVFDGEVLTPG
ncbi:MAG TPA: HopJ type III effector protein [Pseudomonadales bacterium]|nr:HopJ type III effector protein [Pseudomonadales bacterium]